MIVRPSAHAGAARQRFIEAIAAIGLGTLSVGCRPATDAGALASPADACVLPREGDGNPPQAIVAGDTGTCAIFGGSTVYCWGALGRMFACPRARWRAGVNHLAVGEGHACAVVGAGGVECCGQNLNNQLGVNRDEACRRNEPACYSSDVPITVPSVKGARRVFAGALQTCAIDADGEVSCWGQGENGDGGQLKNAAPRKASSLERAERLAIGAAHVCALLADGTAACSGSNTDGALGTGTSRTRAGPSRVPGLSGVIDVAAGWWSSCALLSTGKIACWGDNDAGQLGDGTTTDRSKPVNVVGIDDAVAIGMGSGHACALRKGGKVSCWGANSVGQLGDGTLEARLRPTDVRGLESESVTQIAVGDAHTCALLGRGAIVCWGSNELGQLGGRKENHSPVPVPLLSAIQVAAPP